MNLGARSNVTVDENEDWEARTVRPSHEAGTGTDPTDFAVRLETAIHLVAVTPDLPRRAVCRLREATDRPRLMPTTVTEAEAEVGTFVRTIEETAMMPLKVTLFVKVAFADATDSITLCNFFGQR